MRSAEQIFDRASHDRLVDVLAASDYTERYFELCNDVSVLRDLDGPRLDLRQTIGLFQATGVQVHFDRRFKVFTFDRQEAAGWIWQGKLLVQRYDRLEPMFEAETTHHVIGSTMLKLADEAGDRHVPPIPRARFLPPHPNRPCFDGDMQTMQRMIVELVALVRWMRELIGKSWAT